MPPHPPRRFSIRRMMLTVAIISLAALALLGFVLGNDIVAAQVRDWIPSYREAARTRVLNRIASDRQQLDAVLSGQDPASPKYRFSVVAALVQESVRVCETAAPSLKDNCRFLVDAINSKRPTSTLCRERDGCYETLAYFFQDPSLCRKERFQYVYRAARDSDNLVLDLPSRYELRLRCTLLASPTGTSERQGIRADDPVSTVLPEASVLQTASSPQAARCSTPDVCELDTRSNTRHYSNHAIGVSFDYPAQFLVDVRDNRATVSQGLDGVPLGLSTGGNPDDAFYASKVALVVRKMDGRELKSLLRQHSTTLSDTYSVAAVAGTFIDHRICTALATFAPHAGATHRLDESEYARCIARHALEFEYSAPERTVIDGHAGHAIVRRDRLVPSLFGSRYAYVSVGEKDAPVLLEFMTPLDDGALTAGATGNAILRTVRIHN